MTPEVGKLYRHRSNKTDFYRLTKVKEEQKLCVFVLVDANGAMISTSPIYEKFESFDYYYSLA